MGRKRSGSSGLKTTRHRGIFERTGADGRASFVVKYHHGPVQKQATFRAAGTDGSARTAALRNAANYKRDFDSGFSERHLPPTYVTLKRISIRHICIEYQHKHLEIWNYDTGMPVRNEGHYNANVVLNKFMEDRLADVSLADFNLNGLSLIDEYLKKRKSMLRHGNGWKSDKTIQLSTIRREFNVLQRVFAVATRKYPGLINHFKGYEIPGSMRRSKGRVAQSYIDRLVAACAGCLGRNKSYVPLAINIAVFTGMRLQEIFNLTWKDIHVRPRRIYIRDEGSKTRNQVGIKILATTEDGDDKVQPRTIVITFPLLVFLALKCRWFVDDGWIGSLEEKVFPMTKFDGAAQGNPR